MLPCNAARRTARLKDRFLEAGRSAALHTWLGSPHGFAEIGTSAPSDSVGKPLTPASAAAAHPVIPRRKSVRKSRVPTAVKLQPRDLGPERLADRPLGRGADHAVSRW